MRAVVGAVVLEQVLGCPDGIGVSGGAVGGVCTCDGVRAHLSGGRVTVRGGVVARWRGSHALAIVAASPSWRAVQIAAAPPGGTLMGACAFEQLDNAQVPRM
jgi:hypothetical protein